MYWETEMTNYRYQLDLIEANLTPKRGSPHLVWRDIGQSQEQAVAGFAEASKQTVAEVRANMVMLSWADARSGAR